MLKSMIMKGIHMSSGGRTIGTVNLDMQMIVKDFFSGLMKEVCHASRRINKGGGIVSNLTPKQEKFVQALISGMSQREAYKEAYNAANMKNEVIDVRASELLKKSKVKVRYEELVNENKEKALYTLENSINDLIWIKEKAKEDILNPKKGLRQGNGTIYLNAVKELNLLNDLYPDKKAKEESKNEKDIAKVLKEALDDI